MLRGDDWKLYGIEMAPILAENGALVARGGVRRAQSERRSRRTPSMGSLSSKCSSICIIYYGRPFRK